MIKQVRFKEFMSVAMCKECKVELVEEFHPPHTKWCECPSCKKIVILVWIRGVFRL